MINNHASQRGRILLTKGGVLQERHVEQRARASEGNDERFERPSKWGSSGDDPNFIMTPCNRTTCRRCEDRQAWCLDSKKIVFINNGTKITGSVNPIRYRSKRPASGKNRYSAIHAHGFWRCVDHNDLDVGAVC